MLFTDIFEDVLDPGLEHPGNAEGQGQRRDVAALLHEDDGLARAAGVDTKFQPIQKKDNCVSKVTLSYPFPVSH
jgi:hypothetical protein